MGTIIVTTNELNRPVQVFNGQYATKLAFPPSILTLLNREPNVWVEVKIGGLPLTPRVQLTSAVQALSVRGIYYDNDAQVIKIGQGYRHINYNPSTHSSIDLVVSGNVGIHTDNPSQARLVINGGGSGGMHVRGVMHVSGNIIPRPVPGGGSDSGVYGAVWN
jgi:hypothetical protein